jgi:protein-S-isoprenylcysteine O-methyltransferase Ste14
MATQDTSIADIIRDAVRDAQDLVRDEIALAKAEAREEVRRLRAGAALVAGAAIAGVVGLVFLLTTIAWALSEGLGWPVWAGFGIVTAVMLITAGALAYLGRSRLGVDRHMPLTVDTVKENMKWMRARTS